MLLLLSRFSHVRLCDPIDGSPPGSPVPGILQARTLEWVAISFSNAWKWKVKVKSLSHVRLLAIPWTTAYQAPPPWDFPGKTTGVGCYCLLWPIVWVWHYLLNYISIRPSILFHFFYIKNNAVVSNFMHRFYSFLLYLKMGFWKSNY